MLDVIVAVWLQVLDEIDTLLKGAAPDFNTAGNMPYLRAVIHETMRCVSCASLTGTDGLSWCESSVCA